MIKCGDDVNPLLLGECKFESNYQQACAIICWSDVKAALTFLSFFFSSFAFQAAVRTARFSQEPADQSVVRGQRVLLSCVVFNYSGIVQWTKDGLALGIGEDLRGKTCYVVLRLSFHNNEFRFKATLNFFELKVLRLHF